MLSSERLGHLNKRKYKKALPCICIIQNIYMCAWQQDRGEEKGGRERERGENRIGFRLLAIL